MGVNLDWRVFGPAAALLAPGPTEAAASWSSQPRGAGAGATGPVYAANKAAVVNLVRSVAWASWRREALVNAPPERTTTPATPGPVARTLRRSTGRLRRWGRGDGSRDSSGVR